MQPTKVDISLNKGTKTEPNNLYTIILVSSDYFHSIIVIHLHSYRVLIMTV